MAIFFPKLLLANMNHEEMHKSNFHAFMLGFDIGDSRDGALMKWDFEGWVGGNNNKLFLKSDGEKLKGQTVERSEFWAMYSRNIDTFWESQIGIRFDDQPNPTNYFVAGFKGLAPYFLETETHLFISEDGDFTARIMMERDFLITQYLITKPYFEINLSAQNAAEKEIGSGITQGEFGIKTRYEFSRKFAPYFDLKYERKFGTTSVIAKKNQENRDNFIAGIGVRLMF